MGEIIALDGPYIGEVLRWLDTAEMSLGMPSLPVKELRRGGGGKEQALRWLPLEPRLGVAPLSLWRSSLRRRRIGV